MSEERTQYEQENDLGSGGGEVDEETYAEAWRVADARRSREDAADDADTAVERAEKQA